MTSITVKNLGAIKGRGKNSRSATREKFIRRGNCRGKLRGAPYLPQGGGRTRLYFKTAAPLAAVKSARGNFRLA